MSIPFTSLKKFIVPTLYIGGALLLLVVAWLCWARMSTNPERVFWSAIERGMATAGVTTIADQEGGGPTMHQVSQHSLGAVNMTHSITRLSQDTTTVVNEMLGTPNADYSRYLSIKTDQKKANGSPLDVSSLEGVWAKGRAGSEQLFQQAVLGGSLPLGGVTIPIGNLDRAARSNLMRQIKRDGVYQVSFTAVKKEHKDGRLLYTYDVKLQPAAYAAMVKQLTKNLGVRGLEQLDPSQYKNEQPLNLQLVVDVRAGYVVRALMPETGYKQDFTGYDIPVRASVPKNAISTVELQRRLQSLQ